MRLKYFLLTVGLLTACFAKLFLELLRLARTDDLYSFIPLIPVISLYLICSRKEPWPPPAAPAHKTAAFFLAAGMAAAALYWFVIGPGSTVDVPDQLALGVTAFLLFFIGICGCFFSAALLRAMAFPLAMLVFMIPLPTGARQAIDLFLQQGSAAVAGGLFQLAGTPVLMDGLRVQLPGISLRVAAECSGIHSSLVLLITSLLAGYLFLRSPVQRATLALLVIPLALLRNGFRIFVIGELCAHYGPEMINSAIHRHGGPLFFALSLVPMLLLLFYFRKTARPGQFPPSSPENSMKSINRVVVTLTVTSLLALAGTGCTAKVKTAYHLQRANKYFAARQFPQAEVEYLNVLRNDQQNPVAIGRLGLIYSEEGRDQRAAPFLIRGCQLATNDLNLELKLGMLCLTMGKFSEARDQAEYVLDHDPRDEDAPLLLARSSSTPGDISAARRRIQKLAQMRDTSALEVGLGTLALDEHDFKSANAAFLRAQALDPKSAGPFSALGNLCVSQNNLKAAEAAFKSAAELSPSESFRQVQYARFEIQIGHAEAAKKLLMKLTETVPDYVPAWIGLVEISLAGKNFDEAKKYFDSAQARDPQSFEILSLGARLDLALGDTTKAIAELDQLAALYPQASSIHYQLALACLADNETARAEQSLSQAINLQPEFTDAVLLLAQLQIKNGAPDEAITGLTQWIARHPKNVQALMLLADADRARGDFDGALAIYRQQEKSDPNNPQISLLMGSTYRQQMNNPAARQAFGRALALAPDNPVAAEQLVDLDLSEQRLADGRQLVARLIAQAPGRAMPRLMEARVLQMQGETNQAETALLKAIELEPGVPDAYLVLAQMYTDSRQNQKAVSLLGTLLGKDPRNVPALMLLGEIRNQDKDYPAAADAYEKLLAINPQCSPALNNLAYLCAENLGQLDRACDLARQARNLLPADPATADTLGWILCKQGQLASALSLLQEAANKIPAEPNIQFHLGLTYYLMGETGPAQIALQQAIQSKSNFSGRDECLRCLAVLAIDPQTGGAAARDLLEKRLANTPRDLIALQRLAVIYQRAGDLNKAAATYDSILALSPRNARAMAGLAQIDSANDPAKAFQLAKAAAELNPDDQNIASLAGRLAYQTGNYQWAFNYLQPVAQNQPANPEVLSDFAHAAYNLGDISTAQAAMQKALLAGLVSSQAGEAHNFLDLIALAASPAQTMAAETRVRAILKSQPDYLPALVVMAVIDQQKSNHPAAEEMFEKVLSHYPDFSPAQKDLAVLYAEDGTNLPRARELAIKAGAAYPNDYALTKALGVIAFRQNNFVEAARLLQAGATDPAGDAELFYYLGISQFRLKHPAQSKDALRHALELKPAGQWAGEATQILAEIK